MEENDGLSRPARNLPRKTPTKKRLAIAWLVMAGLFGSVALFQLFCMLAGIYDPVTADEMPPERVPALRAWLITIIVTAMVTALLAFHYARAKTNVT